jgi:hypothetical protein
VCCSWAFIIFILLGSVVFLFSEKILRLLERLWKGVYDEIYDPTSDSFDPLAEFTGLDENRSRKALRPQDLQC